MKYTRRLNSFDYTINDYRNLLNLLTTLGFVIDKNKFKELEHTNYVYAFMFFTKVCAETGLKLAIINEEGKAIYTLTNDLYTIYMSNGMYELHIDDETYKYMFLQNEDIILKHDLISARLFTVGFINRQIEADTSEKFKIVRLCDDIRKSLYENHLENNKNAGIISLTYIYEKFVKKELGWMIEKGE